MDAKEIEAQLNKIQVELMSTKFVCTRVKGGEPCTRQHDKERNHKGQFLYYFAPGCKVVESFCPACSAYWHVAVARNQMLELLRQA